MPIRSGRKRRRRPRGSDDSSSESESDAPSRRSGRASRKGLKKSKSRKKPSSSGSSRRRRRSLSDSSSRSSYHSDSTCSTCDRRGRSPSPPPSRDKKRKEKRKRKERGRTRDRSLSRSLSCSTCSGGRDHRSRSRSYTVEKKRDRKRVKLLPAKVNESESAVKDKIIQAYDDFPPKRSRSARNGVCDESENAVMDSVVHKGGEDVILKDDNVKSCDNVTKLTGNADIEKGKNVAVGKNANPEYLELSLRMKALENFKRFRVKVLASKICGNDQKNGSVKNVSLSPKPVTDNGDNGDNLLNNGDKVPKEVTSPKNQLMESAAAADHNVLVEDNQPESESPSLLYLQEVYRKPRVRSVISIPLLNEGSNSVVDYIRDSSAQDGTAVKIDAEDVCAQDVMQKDESADNVMEALTDSSLAATDSRIESTGHAEEPTGARFQEKTFSRMHDGETVQVSYKVYIPKKKPALERRRLQR